MSVFLNRLTITSDFLDSILKLVFCIQAIVRESICYFTSNPTGNIYLCFKEPTEYDFTFSYMIFLEALCYV